ncbi:RelE toxin [Desulfoluna limicola]|uniref:RelE toxin n=1 Tax=Desulfoluna limicola TaxID=2810562 RepID=A0ABN6F7T4_9BACT|nr:type II toxin-antitoxin system RelE/ParE family toxin [Desulfoluna limicola]BCS97432.1 RelE toxin [Desulfoluna limicola]
MPYKLKFLPTALKEWKKLDNTISTQLKKKLEEVLQNPRIQANQLRNFENHYKIKLRASGYRLVYEVIDDEIVVLVIAIGKREGNKIYEVAKLRSGV